MALVTEQGFVPSAPIEFLNVDDAWPADDSIAIDLANDVNLESIEDKLNRVHTIRIDFPSSADGRGFSLAKALRHKGYKGRLRAVGPLISDQFRYALTCGFDEVEINDELAARQPESHWKDFGQSSYANKLSSPLAPSERSDDLYYEQVTEVQHYGDDLFRFKTTRPDSFRFDAGEFVMMGLETRGTRILRAYSIASASYDESLEFYSIKVPDGELTKKLKWIKVGDTIVLKKKTTGSLILGTVNPGKRLFLHSTGTGIAPFASLIKEPAVYEQFEQVILTHTCRFNNELDYSRELVEAVKADEYVGELASAQLVFRGSTTREPGVTNSRITHDITSGELYTDLGIAPLNPESDRIMICGSKGVTVDMKAIFAEAGFTQGSLNRPGSFVWERAFVD